MTMKSKEKIQQLVGFSLHLRPLKGQRSLHSGSFLDSLQKFLSFLDGFSPAAVISLIRRQLCHQETSFSRLIFKQRCFMCMQGVEEKQRGQGEVFEQGW